VATAQQRGEPLPGHGSTVHALGFTPDGKLLLSGSGDRALKVWTVAECLRGRKGR
jgi:WD40 repeat protein